jgi:hypothetical protein
VRTKNKEPGALWAHKEQRNRVPFGRTKEQGNKRTREQKNKGTKEQGNKRTGGPLGAQKNQEPRAIWAHKGTKEQGDERTEN